MKISQWSPKLLSRQLRRQGVCLSTGPFVCRIRSPLPEVAHTLTTYYADFPVVEDGSFADIHLELRPGSGLRRWIRPQVVCVCEDQVPFKPHPQRLAGPILEWGLNWCVANLAHWYLMIHAAVLERQGQALILSAKAESGKSTLCAALMLRGWRLFSDEIALIRPQDGQLVPLARPVCLKGPSIELIRRWDSGGQMGPTFPDPGRGGIALVRPSRESVERMVEPAPAGWIVFPQFLPGSPTQFSPTPKALAFIHLADNSFNYSLLGTQGFDALTRLMDGVRACYNFRYSNLNEAVDWLERLVQRSENPPANIPTSESSRPSPSELR